MSETSPPVHTSRSRREGRSSCFDIPLGIQSWVKDESLLVLHQAVRMTRKSCTWGSCHLAS